MAPVRGSALSALLLLLLCRPGAIIAFAAPAPNVRAASADVAAAPVCRGELCDIVAGSPQMPMGMTDDEFGSGHPRSGLGASSWLMDPESLVFEGHAMPMHTALGAVRVLSMERGGGAGVGGPTLVEAHYSLTNDLDFTLTAVEESPGAEQVLSAAEETDGVAAARISTNMMKSAKYVVRVNGETVAVADATDFIVEEMIRKTFFRDGAQLELHRVEREVEGRKNKIVEKVIMDNGNGSSVHLYPMSSMIARIFHTEASPASPMKRKSIEGEWVTTLTSDGRKSLNVVLSVIRTGAMSYLFELEGLNKHRMVVMMKRGVEGTGSSRHSTGEGSSNASVMSVQSGEFEAVDSSMQETEKRFVKLLSIANNIFVEEFAEDQMGEQGGSSNSRQKRVHLAVFNSQRPDLKVVFSRAPHADSARHYHEAPTTRWEVIPASLDFVDPNKINSSVESAFNRAKLTTHTPCILELRTEGPIAVADVYMGYDKHIRSAVIRTGTPAREPIRSHENLAENWEEGAPADEENNFVNVINGILRSMTDIEVDASGNYLTVLGEHATVSFMASPGPSSGLWVLDHRFSKWQGQPLAHVISPSTARGVKLFLTGEEASQQSGEFHAKLRGGVSRLEFAIENHAPWPSMSDLRVSKLASRNIQDLFEGEAVPGGGGVERVLTQFMREGVRVSTVVGDDAVALVFRDADSTDEDDDSSSNDRNVLTFVHPQTLTRQLAGDWRLVQRVKTTESGVEAAAKVPKCTMKLMPGGVGRMFGKLSVNEKRFFVKLHELEERDAEEDVADGQQRKRPLSADGLTIHEWTADLKLIPEPRTPHWNPFKHFLSVHDHHHHHYHDDAETDGGRSASSVPEILGQPIVIDTEAGSPNTMVIRRVDDQGVRTTLTWLRVVSKRTRNLIQGDWFVEFATAAAAAGGGEAPIEVAAALEGDVDGRHTISFQYVPRSVEEEAAVSGERISIEVFHATVKKLGAGGTASSNSAVVATFTLQINPFHAVRIVDFVAAGSGTTPAADNKSKLQSLVMTTLSSFARSSEAYLEVSPSDLLLTDGSSVVAMTRGVPIFLSLSFEMMDGGGLMGLVGGDQAHGGDAAAAASTQDQEPAGLVDGLMEGLVESVALGAAAANMMGRGGGMMGGPGMMGGGMMGPGMGMMGPGMGGMGGMMGPGMGGMRMMSAPGPPMMPPRGPMGPPMMNPGMMGPRGPMRYLQEMRTAEFATVGQPPVVVATPTAQRAINLPQRRRLMVEEPGYPGHPVAGAAATAASTMKQEAKHLMRQFRRRLQAAGRLADVIDDMEAGV